MPAPADESPNLTMSEMYSLPIGDVNSSETCEKGTAEPAAMSAALRSPLHNPPLCDRNSSCDS